MARFSGFWLSLRGVFWTEEDKLAKRPKVALEGDNHGPTGTRIYRRALPGPIRWARAWGAGTTFRWVKSLPRLVITSRVT